MYTILVFFIKEGEKASRKITVKVKIITEQHFQEIGLKEYNF